MKNERDIRFFTKEREREARRQGLEKGRAEGMEKGRAEGRAEGLEKGLEKGRAEGESGARRSIAVAMKTAGIDMAQISQITGLDKEIIEAL